MLKTKIYIVIGLLIIGVLGAYYINFNISNVIGLSNKQADWGSFGAYLGGVIGPILAFLAYLGIRDQIQLQKIMIEQQDKAKALENHILRIKESFERLSNLTEQAILPIEKKANFVLNKTVKSDVKAHVANIDVSFILEDLIHAGRLIQGAEFVFKTYLSLIDESSSNLQRSLPLNEHKWIAVVTWREFEKKAYFLFLLMKKARPFAEANPDLYSKEYKEIIIYISAYEGWERDWQNLGLGF